VTESKRGERELDRLVFVSDAVFAIVMTLLVLEITLLDVPPHLAAAEAPPKVLALGSKFFSYVLSFLVIETYWIAYHQTIRYVVSYDRDAALAELTVLAEHLVHQRRSDDGLLVSAVVSDILISLLRRQQVTPYSRLYSDL